MHIDGALALRVDQLKSLASSHPQPWLGVLWRRQRTADWVAERVEHIISSADPGDRSLSLVKQLKPDAGSREFVLATLEQDVAMSVQSAPLVRALEAQRRSISLANRVVFHDPGYWQLSLFPKENKQGGAWREYTDRKAHIRSTWPWLVRGDIATFYPSVRWKPAERQVAQVVQWETGDVRACARLYLQLLAQLQGRIPGLPVGPELSGVLANGVLAGLDDLLLEWLTPRQAVRWSDDILAGTLSESLATRILAAATAPVTALGLEWHPKKTHVHPFAQEEFVASAGPDWGQADDGDNDEFADQALLEATAPRAILTRAQASSYLSAVRKSGLPAAEEVWLLASQTPRLLLRGRQVLDRIAELCGGDLPAEVTDRLLAACRTVVADSPADGDLANLLLQLAERRVALGDPGAHVLRKIAADRRRAERTQVCAAWLLAQARQEVGDSYLERLPESSLSGARGLLAAAIHSGLKPTTYHWHYAGLAA